MGLRNIRDMRLRFKLLAVYLGLSILLFACGGWGALVLIKRGINASIESELRRSTRSIIDMVETTALGSIKNYLRAVAERNLEIAWQFHRRFLEGELSEAQARLEIRRVLLGQAIGKTGYIYCIDSQGIATVHPRARVEGNNWAHFDFVRRQMELKTGYIEYQWQNPGETAARPKALYMVYFEPYDWIISVSTYRDEFRELLPMEEIRRSVKALRFGTSGYTFVADREGNTIIHPELEGENLLTVAGGQNEAFEEMVKEEFGQVTYWWQNPGEREPREKLALYGYIPELQWVVGSTGYIDEIYAPIQRARRLTLLFVGLSVVVSTILTLLVSRSITRRLEHLMTVIHSGDRGDLTVRADPGANDEIGRLSRIFNAFLERLQASHQRLAEEVEEHRSTAHSLRQARDFNALILSTVDALVVVLDTDGRVVRFNQACEASSGYRADEIEGRRPFKLLIPEEERETVRAVFEELTNEKRGNRTINHWITKDGRRRLIQWSNAIALGMDGQTDLIVSAGIDITEQKAVENALQESEAQFEAVFNQTYQLIGILTPDGTLRSANQTALDFAGVKRADLIGRKFWEAPFWQHSEENQLRVQEAVERAASGEFSRMEVTHVRHDGALRHFDFSLKPVRDDAGRIFMLIPEGRDITERKKAEEILRLSEEKYRILVENAHDAIFVIQDEKLRYVNRSTEALIGYPAAELRQLPFDEFIHPEDRERVSRRHRAWLDGWGAPSTIDFRILHRSGTTQWIDLNAIRLEWEGRPAVMGFARDTTSQKTMEAQLLQSQKMDAVGTLAGGIAHDFNNTLQAISGYTQLLLMEGFGSDRHKEMLATIRHACDHARELTRQLLTFGRKIESQLVPLDLNAELRPAVKLLQRTLPRMIEIDVQPAEDLRVVEADPTQLEQILMNLGINAGHAMPDGGSLIIETMNVDLDEGYCRTHLGAKPGSYALLSVTDNGCGMDADTRTHIFEPFFTTRETGRGTGLGLAMVYGIVKNHRGYITCYSEPGQGTTFKIYFPAVTKTPVVVESLEEGQVVSGGSEVVLIVDDDPALRQLACELLENFGYRTTAVEDGETALERFRAQGPKIDLVILDLNMPGMGGLRCLEALHAIDPAVPVLIASGYSPVGETKILLDRLAQGFVSKPYALKALLKVVRETLDRR